MEKPPPPIKGQKYQIPKKGSLGLLALGYRGIQAWRKTILNQDELSEHIVGPVVAQKELKAKEKKNEEK